MARLAYAARQLLKQVNGEAVGDPDGLGTVRTVMVTTTAPLDAIEVDDRVRRLVVVATDLGPVALVEFERGRLGETADPFDLG